MSVTTPSPLPPPLLNLQNRDNKRRRNVRRNNSKKQHIARDVNLPVDPNNVTVRDMWYHHEKGAVLQKHFAREDPIIQQFKFFNHGLVVGKQENKLQLAMYFHPFSEMSEEEKGEYQSILDYMHQDRQYHEEIKSNAAAKIPDQSGKMYGIGWRGGTTHGQAFGLYSPNPGKVTEEAWRAHVMGSKAIAKLYKQFFKRLSRSAYKSMVRKAAEAKIPSLGDTSYRGDDTEEDGGKAVDGNSKDDGEVDRGDDAGMPNLEGSDSKDEGDSDDEGDSRDRTKEKKSAFASNLYYTFKDFSNKLHYDNDINEYTFGMWFPVHDKDFRLATKEEGYSLKGGEFVWGRYGVGADFSACDGVVMLIWRGRDEIHGTLEAQAAKGFTLVGSSVQINGQFANKVARYHSSKKERTFGIINNVDNQCKALKKKKKSNITDTTTQ